MVPLVAVELAPDTREALASGLRVLAIVVIAVLVRRAARRAISGTVERIRARASATDPAALPRGDRSRRTEARVATVSSVLNSQASVVVYGIALLLILGEIQVNLAPLLASAGFVAAALGFGAQSLVRDTLAGIFVLIEDQYGVGDVIDAGPATGTVERVTLRSTQLRDLAGTVWHVPNGTIARVGNKSQHWACAVVEIVVSHEADVRLAREVMRRVAGELAGDPGWAAVRPGSKVDDQGISDLSPTGVTLRLVVETEPASQWLVERELRLRIKEAFAEAAIPLEVHHP